MKKKQHQSQENFGYGRKAPMRERKVVYGLPAKDMIMSKSVMSMQHPLGADTNHTPVS